MRALKELFLTELAHRHDSEVRLSKGTAAIADAATSPELQKLLLTHLEVTKVQIIKLDQIFKVFGVRVREATCATTVALLQEGERIAAYFSGSPAINAALVSIAQKIEHHEIASYGCLREWAILLANKEAEGLLGELLDEEKSANRALIKLARFRCNKESLGDSGTADTYCDRYGHLLGTKAA